MRKVIQGHRSQAWRSLFSSEGNHNLCKTQRESYSRCCPPGEFLTSLYAFLANTAGSREDSKATEFPSLILPLGSESQASLGASFSVVGCCVLTYTCDAWQVPIVDMTEETTWVMRDGGGGQRVRVSKAEKQRLSEAERQRDLRNFLVFTLPGTLASQLASQLSHKSQLSNCLCSPSTHPLVHKTPRPLLTRLFSSANGGRGMPTSMKLKELKFVTHFQNVWCMVRPTQMAAEYNFCLCLFNKRYRQARES